jgi:hypothetical protein
LGTAKATHLGQITLACLWFSITNIFGLDVRVRPLSKADDFDGNRSKEGAALLDALAAFHETAVVDLDRSRRIRRTRHDELLGEVED